MHTKYSQKANCYGKYIVFAKVGNQKRNNDGIDCLDNVLIVYSKLFDEVPKINDLKDLRLLLGALDSSITQFKNDNSEPPDNYPTKAKTRAQCSLGEIQKHKFYRWIILNKSYFNEKNYYYIGNDSSIELSDEGFATLFDEKSNEYNIIDDFNEWGNITY